MEEKKVVTISENNIFHKHRKEIGEISEKEKCDVGVAASKLAHEKGWGDEVTDDRNEFNSYVSYMFRTNGTENKVERYFNGGDVE